MSQQRIALGKLGEDLACEELERRGYAVLVRRWRQRGGEIDIIARDGETLVFVEVKARRGHDFGDASEAVTRFKRRRLVRLATHYAAIEGWLNRPCRFDIVAIHFEANEPVVTLYPNAFEADS
jgi:putative endonuclease